MSFSVFGVRICRAAACQPLDSTPEALWPGAFKAALGVDGAFVRRLPVRLGCFTGLTVLDAGVAVIAVNLCGVDGLTLGDMVVPIVEDELAIDLSEVALSIVA